MDREKDPRRVRVLAAKHHGANLGVLSCVVAGVSGKEGGRAGCRMSGLQQGINPRSEAKRAETMG